VTPKEIRVIRDPFNVEIRVPSLAPANSIPPIRVQTPQIRTTRLRLPYAR